MINRRDFIKITGSAVVSPVIANIEQKKERTPNILLIVSEDHGPDIGCYGDKFAATPNLDKLAAEGVLFSNAYTTHSVCSPARSSILTGLYPHQNGQIGLATHKFSMFKDFPNIPSILKNSGYHTGIIGKLHVNPESAFSFDMKWDDRRAVSFNSRNMSMVADKVEKFISESSGKPFFLMVNYPDAHFPLLKEQAGLPTTRLNAKDVDVLPYIGADSERLCEGVADYYNCINRLDAGIGMLLDKIQEAEIEDDTIVIYLSDHGAQFSRGKTSCYEAAIHVPMIIKWSNRIRPNQTEEGFVSFVDILPTIIDVLGINSPAALPGMSLIRLIEGEISKRNYLCAEHTADTSRMYFPQRCIRDDRYKLIVNFLQDRQSPFYDMYVNPLNAFFKYGTSEEEIANSNENVKKAYATWRNPPLFELYDLQSDPYEFDNLVNQVEMKPVIESLLQKLTEWQIDTHDAIVYSTNLNRLTSEMDSVSEKYQGHAYTKDADFEWQYHKYLNG